MIIKLELTSSEASSIRDAILDKHHAYKQKLRNEGELSRGANSFMNFLKEVADKISEQIRLSK